MFDLVFALPILAILGLLVALDRKQARWKRVRFVMEAHAEKALRDRTSVVRIPAQQLVRLFNLDTRVILSEREVRGDVNPTPHPGSRRRRFWKRRAA